MSSETVNSTNFSSSKGNVAASLAGRVKREFGPVLPGLILDLADLCSLTRTVGPWASFPIGFAIGIWLSLYYPFGFGWRFVIALGSGLYTLTPGTEYIPLATILTCLGRFIETPLESQTVSEPMPERGTTDLGAAEPEPVSPMRSAETRAACPECGSMTLRYGESVHQFRPAGSSIWAKGHAVNAFVCLDCGFVGHYVASRDLDVLRENQST